MAWRRRAVRWAGVALLLGSLVVGLVVFGLDTTVTTGATWKDGVFHGAVEIRDPSLTRQRRDGLSFAGALALVGGALVGLTHRSRDDKALGQTTGVR